MKNKLQKPPICKYFTPETGLKLLSLNSSNESGKPYKQGVPGLFFCLCYYFATKDYSSFFQILVENKLSCDEILQILSAKLMLIASC